MKKIALLSFLYKPNIGGVENSIYALSKSYVKLGFDVNVYCTTEPNELKLNSFELFENIPVNRYKWIHYKFLIFPFNVIYNLLRLGRWIKSQISNSQCISRHHYMCFALFLAGKNDYIYIVPEVVKKNKTYRKKLGWDKRIIMEFNHLLQKFAIKNSTKTLVFSHNVQEQLKSIGINYPTEICAPGLEFEKFNVERDFCRKRLGFSKDLKYFLGLSRMVESKGYQYALKALASKTIENLRIVLVGDGPYKKDLKELAESLNIIDRVLFIGRTDSPEIFYKASDAFLMTSLNEAFGQTILEAAAADLPIISFKKGVFGNITVETATEEILGNRDGVYYCDPDLASLSLSYEKALHDMDNKINSVCYQDIKEKYSWDNLALELIK